jgi:aminoglycoside 3-N-acetyltransferase I
LEIVGMLIAYKLQKIDIRKIELLLYEIEVKRDFRKKGIATQLIEHLKEIGRKEGAHEIWVLMDIENKDATQLYDSTFQKNKKQIMYSINLK